MFLQNMSVYFDMVSVSVRGLLVGDSSGARGFLARFPTPQSNQLHEQPLRGERTEQLARVLMVVTSVTVYAWDLTG